MSESAGNPSQGTADKGVASANQQAGSGVTAQSGGEGVPEEVTDLLAADPPTWPWVWAAFGILAVGTALSYLVWRLIKPTDFMPSSNYAAFAGVFIMAVAIERVLEPFSGLFVPEVKKKKAEAAATAARASLAKAAAAAPRGSAGKAGPQQAQQQADVAKKAFHRAQSARAVLMWATASVLAMLVCAALGIFLLRSVETPSATGTNSPSRSVSSSSAAPAGPSPAKDPNRLLDLLVTGLVVGAGTKPLHDLISQIQTSSGNSKAKLLRPPQ